MARSLLFQKLCRAANVEYYRNSNVMSMEDKCPFAKTIERLQAAGLIALKTYGQNAQGRHSKRGTSRLSLRMVCARHSLRPRRPEKVLRFLSFLSQHEPSQNVHMCSPDSPCCEGSEAHSLSRKPGHGSGMILYKGLVSLCCV